MIQDMGWIPADFPSQGNTALMTARFSEAITAFGLQAKVLAGDTRRHAVPAAPPEVDAALEEVEIRSHSSTELVASDTEVCKPAQLEACAQCDSFDISAADPVSPDRCVEEARPWRPA